MKSLILLLCCLPAFASNAPPFESAMVVSQNVGPYTGGAISTASGGSATASAIGVAVIRAANVVVIQTAQRRLTLLELTGKGYMLLLVNGTVDFHMDGNRAVLRDANGKTHKFYITRMEDISQGNPK